MSVSTGVRTLPWRLINNNLYLLYGVKCTFWPVKFVKFYINSKPHIVELGLRRHWCVGSIFTMVVYLVTKKFSPSHYSYIFSRLRGGSRRWDGIDCTGAALLNHMTINSVNSAIGGKTQDH